MTWSTSDALTFAHHLLDCPPDPDKSGTMRLAEAFIRLHAETVKLRLREEERLVLQTFAWDHSASQNWPAVCETVETLLVRQRV
jgi:hypothetical protein